MLGAGSELTRQREGERERERARHTAEQDGMAGTRARRVHRAAPAPPRLHRYSHLLDEMVGCGDMVLLEPLTEEGLLMNLKQRYETGEIYVSGYMYHHPLPVSLSACLLACLMLPLCWSLCHPLIVQYL